MRQGAAMVDDPDSIRNAVVGSTHVARRAVER
jgi:hypothetical protein